jgi:hypothetical protein
VDGYLFESFVDGSLVELECSRPWFVATPGVKHKQQKEEIRIRAITDPRWNSAPAWYIGIDDTDNLQSRGTGFRARQLAQQLQEAGLARLRGVTRHQLFVSPEIPYTSHNSSACLELDFFDEARAPVVAHCRDYLLRESAEGSDAGLCVAAATQVSAEVRAFGFAAKERVLQQSDAHALADRHGIFLEGLTGTRQGVIGALSAAGLHATRNDGRFLWMRGVRDLEPGAYALGQLRGLTDIEAFVTIDGGELADPGAEILITEWARPVFADGRAVLFLEEDDDARTDHRTGPGRWRVAAKEFIKRF